MLQWLQDWNEEVRSNDEFNATEKTRRTLSAKTTFDVQSMVLGFKSYSLNMMHMFEGIHLVTHKTSQDYVELFFACQRAQQGQNNNPTEAQYGKSILDLHSFLYRIPALVKKTKPGNTFNIKGDLSRPKDPGILT